MNPTPDKPDLGALARQWGARQVPFGPSKNPGWFSSPALQEAWQQLDQAAALRSVLLLYGPNGVGKSALLSHWADQLDARRYQALKFTQATLSGSSLLAALTEKLGKPASCRRERNLSLIQEALLELERCIPIILLEEAQHYTYGALEEIRLLLGLNLCRQPAFALVLIGDDYFLNTLKMRHHRALFSRIAFAIQLPCWTTEQAQAYLTQELAEAGIQREAFEPAAKDLIVSSAGGLARSLNLIARNAWIAAARAQQNLITPDHVRHALDQVPYIPGMHLPPASQE